MVEHCIRNAKVRSSILRGGSCDILFSVDEYEFHKKIDDIEKEMAQPAFWDDKARAQEKVRELNQLKASIANLNKYDKGDAIITIFSGAGGDDAEDWSRMLFDMYQKYIGKTGFGSMIIHKNENDNGGYRNITFSIDGKNAYKTLKNESGVHRLVRISPFNAKKQRHTSFSMVEVVPKFTKNEIAIPEQDVKIEFSRSSGPGGQNVNKRETAVRLVHLPTGISVHSSAERSQSQNKEIAMEILQGKLHKRAKEEEESKKAGLFISKTTEAEWGSQIRSYVIHPYKLVKDHRTGFEHKNPEAVFLGELDSFIEAEKNL